MKRIPKKGEESRYPFGRVRPLLWSVKEKFMLLSEIFQNSVDILD